MPTTPPSTIEDRYAMIAALPRPRPLRRTPIRHFNVAAATVVFSLLELALLVFLYRAWQAKPNLGSLFIAHPLLVFNVVVVPYIVSLVRAGRRKEKNLVANGEVAIATITRRLDTDREWRVAYEFQGRSGQAISNQALDSTAGHSLKEGDRMLVYYDPKNPDNALAQCTASYEPAIAANRPGSRFS